MTAPTPTRDFDDFAAEYDRHLPRLQPISEALLERLPEIADGGSVLDVATGTGEPALTLARRSPGLRVVGVDSAPAMVDVARRKAAAEGLTNARFEVMAAENLGLADDSATAVVSRLGLLLFGDQPAAQAVEMARVLVPGGPYAVAVWDRFGLNSSQHLSIATLRAVLPADRVPNLAWMEDLAAGGTREKWLRDGGVSSVHSDLVHWTSTEADFSSLWDLQTTGPLGPVFLGLGADGLARARDQLAELAAQYLTPEGSYAFPMACRILWGRK